MKEILIKPHVTEKSFDLASQSKYVFQVGNNASKNEISKTVKDYYKVDVEAVNILRRKPKTRRHGKTRGSTMERKLAVVTLKKGQKIELFGQAK